ncbi:Protein of unknown function [Formivibrio citricus]|uniref:DUF3999 domain-containing protein n=1 Tax=Formivibrio citricus TaxID=83765 RepID=A0A1I4WK90_9NEIS|nr:DUF3999 domain-containing protein [Formivibrio citricus]SFN13877.1 Protein of unknown function [Formivibrio citricus]
MKLPIFLVSLLALPVLAAEAPQDFAWRVPLEVKAGAPYQRITLPMAAYIHASHTDLRDLRVFNSEGRPVPLAHVVPRGSNEKTTRSMPLRWFPLTAPQTAPGASLDVHVRQDAKGALLEVKSRAPAASGEQLRRGYVLDASAIEKRQAITALTLDWRDGQGFQLLDVEASDNLQDWRRVRSGVQLARLDYNGERIERRRIEIGGLPGRYLRLLWREPARAPELTSAEIEETVAQWRAPERVWTGALTPLRSPLNLHQGEYHYRLPQTLPVTRLRLTLPQGNVLLPLEILSPDQDRRHWSRLARCVAYRITEQGREWLQDEITLPGYPLREFIVRFDRRSSQGMSAPVLEAGIEAGQVVFLAEGKAPYTLAVGNAHAAGRALPLGTLAPGLDTPGGPKLADAQVLVGQAASGVAAAQAETGPADWKRIALWAVLVVGVLAMILMAWQLVRQMKKPHP